MIKEDCLFLGLVFIAFSFIHLWSLLHEDSNLCFLLLLWHGSASQAFFFFLARHAGEAPHLVQGSESVNECVAE